MTGALASIERHVEELERDGYTILRDVVETELVDAMVETIVRLEDELGIGPGGLGPTNSTDGRKYFEGKNSHRVRNLLARDPIFQRAPVHPGVLPFIEAALEPQCLLQAMLSIAVGPDEAAQVIHADDMYLRLPRPHLALTMNTLWALSDFTEENGATRVVAGSHLSAEVPGDTIPGLSGLDNQTSDGTIAAEMSRGSVLVLHGSVHHGAGANRTTERRFGMAVSYCRGWVRQQENLQMGVPLDLIRTFEPRLQELIGLRGLYEGFIGNVDYADPAQAILGM